jgi:MFS family permease
MFTFFQSIYLAEWGADPIVIGVIFSGMGIAMAVSQVPAGYLADRFGRRPMMWASWITGAISAWMMALAPGLSWFILAMILYGLTSFVLAPMNSYVTGARGTLSVGRALTFTSAAFNLGAVIGPLVGGQIGEALGLRTVYTIAAGIFVISTAVILFIRPQAVKTGQLEGASPLHPFQNRLFLGFCGIMAVVVFATYLPQPLTANFLQSERGLSLAAIGQLGSICSLGSAVIAIAMGRMKSAQGFLAGQVLVAGFCLLLWQGKGFVGYALGYFLLGGYRLCRSMGLALGGSLIHSANLGLAYGSIETVNAIALVLAPLAAGVIYTQSPSLVYPASLALLALALVLSIVFIPRFRSVDPATIRKD